MSWGEYEYMNYDFGFSSLILVFSCTTSDKDTQQGDNCGLTHIHIKGDREGERERYRERERERERDE